VRAAIPPGTEPAGIRNVYASSALLTIAPEDDDPDTLLRSSLRRFLGTEATPRCLVFDQFEELLTDESVFALKPMRWQKEQEAFFRQVAGALSADPLLRVVFIMRKEHLAEIERFSSWLPEGLRTRFHLEPLREAAALAAVTLPVEEHTRRSFAEGVPQKLVEGLLTMRVDVHGEVKEVPGRYVEPLHLQLVCESLWHDLRDRPDEAVITEQDVQTYGDIDQVLGELYEGAVRAASASAHMREGTLRKRIESEFITPSGARAPVFLDTAADGKGTARAIAELERRQLVREEEWRPGAHLYELTHDRLVEPIRASNEAYRGRRRWRRWVALGLAIGVLAGGIATAVVLFTGGGGAGFDLSRYVTLPSRGRPPTALASASFSPDGKLVVTAGADGVARVWNWSDKEGTVDPTLLPPSPDALSSASFSPDGTSIVTASVDGRARVWTWPQTLLASTLAAGAPLSSASFSTDGTLVVTAAADGVARVWAWSGTPTEYAALRSGSALSAASFSPDGKLVVTAGADGVAQVWEWAAVPPRRVAELRGGEGALLSASFSPDGRFVVTGGEDGATRVWNLSERTIVNTLAESARVTSTAFSSPGGQFVLTASTDGSARIWGWQSKKDPVVLAQPNALSSAAFSPVGALVVTAQTNGFAAIYAPNQVG
jgi:roadblock/LC7 domain-containing protein